MEFNREEVLDRMIMERERIDIKNKRKLQKLSLRRRRHMRQFSLIKRNARLARITEELRIVLADTNLMDDDCKKHFITE